MNYRGSIALLLDLFKFHCLEKINLVVSSYRIKKQAAWDVGNAEICGSVLKWITGICYTCSCKKKVDKVSKCWRKANNSEIHNVIVLSDETVQYTAT